MATLNALEKAGASQKLAQYSLLVSQIQSTGNHIESFDNGSVLLSANDTKTGQKLDVLVESDSLQGDKDNIEVSFRSYKQQRLQKTPFMPLITFSMKMEAGVWKLNEISINLHLPLADPDLLKSFTEGAKSASATHTITSTAMPLQIQTQPIQGRPVPGQAIPGQADQSQNSEMSHPFDSSILAAMSSITSAEAIYSSTYRSVGYTCTLSDLDGFGGGEPNEHQAMLIPSSLASGKKYGYEFTLSGCSGSPATGFQLVAAPRINNHGHRAFCSNKTGAIRAAADGNPASCVASGTPIE